MILGILIVSLLMSNAFIGLAHNDPRTFFYCALGAIGWGFFIGANYL